MSYVWSVGLLLGLSALALGLAIRVVVKQDAAFRRGHPHADAIVFDLARAWGITYLLWVATALAMLVDPRIAAVPLLEAERYTMAATTALMFCGMACGTVAFLVFRLRHLRGVHEWQLMSSRP